MKRIPVSDVIFRNDLYPRIKTDPKLVNRYRLNLDLMPPITVNQDNILIDGWHRLKAFASAGQETIPVVIEVLDASEIIWRAHELNQSHGWQPVEDDKRKFAQDTYKATDIMERADVEARLLATLSIGTRTLADYLSSIKRDERRRRTETMLDLWLRCLTLQEIAKVLNVSQPSVTDKVTKEYGFLDTFINYGGYATIDKDDDKRAVLDIFISNDIQPHTKPPLYDVWTAAKASNEVKYPGMSEASFVDNLLYMYTDPGDIVIDPFAGGGSTIDVCRKRLRRVLASDLTPIPARKHEIEEHDITSGLLMPHRPNAVSLVYLDPPYGAQVAGAYSDKPEDLANGTNEAIAPAMVKIIKAYMGKLRSGAHIALIIQSTQWHAKDRKPVDHVWTLAQAGLPMPVHRIQAPYSTEQANPQMVNWAKEERDVLVISREIVIWEVK